MQPTRSNTEAELERLLQMRLHHPELAPAIDTQIRANFVETYAILVLDSSGFSHFSQTHGIIEALAQVERLRGVVVPILTAHQGNVFKLEVDNVYAVLPSVEGAIAAARAIIVQAAAIARPVSIGIGYGDLIMISGGNRYRDVFGEEMNLASKLGEDVAGRDEILLTEAAFRQLGNKPTPWEPQEVEFSGMRVLAYRYQVKG